MSGSYDEAVCCGDLVGYGPDPNAVTDWVRDHVPKVIRGNHDKAAVGLEDLEWFNPVARTAALWTAQELTPENRDYLRTLRKGPVPVDHYQIAHGSPLDEDEYLSAAVAAAHAFPYLDNDLTFFGHTHLQGGFIWTGGGVRVLNREKLQDGMALPVNPDDVYLLNPGAVGQPRDGDPRAGYILYDPGERLVRYYRERYDVKTVQKKIRRAGLPDILAERLAVGA